MNNMAPEIDSAIRAFILIQFANNPFASANPMGEQLPSPNYGWIIGIHEFDGTSHIL